MTMYFDSLRQWLAALAVVVIASHCASGEQVLKSGHGSVAISARSWSWYVDRNADKATYCNQLKWSTVNALGNFLEKFGTSGALAGSYVVTHGQRERALEYTKNCSDPRYGPLPKNILLTKWNNGGTFIYPGTKWCGAGNISTAQERYGEAVETDMCCERHDHSTDYILAGGKKHSLKNKNKFTVTNCKDDMELFNCLYRVNSSMSLEFGQAFFDALHVPCFAHTYPKECVTWSGWWGNWKCKHYVLRKDQPKQWQFIYPPNFYGAYMKKWFPEFTPPKPDEADSSWNLYCNQDPDLDCSHYEFIEPEEE